MSTSPQIRHDISHSGAITTAARGGGGAVVDIILHSHGGDNTRWEGHRGEEADDPIVVKGPGQDAFIVSMFCIQLKMEQFLHNVEVCETLCLQNTMTR